ncbi:MULTISPECIES: type II toxin-antitoxin system ParD family antitoxin [unclassified Okeania]|uniref:ribbon-helix-helix domain-containing protein n=1 Tax=unclassified Okeania TaxID=2634635 RepID=UPI0013B83241|nr:MULTISPECIES: type II toxin-antitoxin system ParD family antitoxin [unclassified Okeania]NES76262.1 type II toxin-antitoxin system ParD family antitoxin [Okeania sp. SIO1H4]NET13743.1 type II toxin-antitoxin system ParD family antitoxin [Okeania sp. SIO1H6]NET19705.1 type II toxin-antitoxin system ParD family antitoxin [Okeania sp. SIO1H5]NET93631.1 type II toxin-antitoxin system ParD family antitoxin [Okeania sp. SIO1H2]
MENIIISLPDSLRVYLEEQLQLGSYKNASEYFMLLVQQDQQRQTKQRLETKLIQGIESGPAEPMTAQDWDEIRQAVRERSVKRS